MSPDPAHAMSEQLAWARWWAYPWKHSHADWRTDPAINALYRTNGLPTVAINGITPCLPPRAHSTVLQIALASTEQLNLMLELIHNILNPDTTTQLSESHYLWCVRLSRALPHEIRVAEENPLRSLRSWVDPLTWQRLRLRFPCEPVREIEEKTIEPGNRPSQLDTLWQAVVWRTIAGDNKNPGQQEWRNGNALQA